MLVLSRKVGERIVVGDGLITITLVHLGHDKCRIGIEAPKEMRVDREEVHEKVVAEGRRRTAKQG